MAWNIALIWNMENGRSHRATIERFLATPLNGRLRGSRYDVREKSGFAIRRTDSWKTETQTAPPQIRDRTISALSSNRLAIVVAAGDVAPLQHVRAEISSPSSSNHSRLPHRGPGKERLQAGKDHRSVSGMRLRGRETSRRGSVVNNSDASNNLRQRADPRETARVHSSARGGRSRKVSDDRVNSSAVASRAAAVGPISRVTMRTPNGDNSHVVAHPRDSGPRNVTADSVLGTRMPVSNRGDQFGGQGGMNKHQTASNRPASRISDPAGTAAPVATSRQTSSRRESPRRMAKA